MTHSNDDENSESLNSKSIANPYRMKGNNVTKQAAWDSVASYVEPFMISNMLRELKPKCTAAAELDFQIGYNALSSKRKPNADPMVEVFDCILTFALASCESKERSRAELMSKGQFVQVRLSNFNTTAACERWTESTNAVAPSTSSSRGSIEISQSTMFSRSKSQYHNVSEDPVHIIWVTKLRDVVKSSSPRLYTIMSNAALLLNDVMEKGSTARQYDNFRMQSLLTDDVPNAKHQAIRNVLHANSCCTCMTLEEHSLSLRGRPDKSQNKTEDLEQSTAMSTTF
eukprot:scaffold2021_cov314-Chaetoceros_neogracile.AAC.7